MDCENGEDEVNCGRCNMMNVDLKENIAKRPFIFIILCTNICYRMAWGESDLRYNSFLKIPFTALNNLAYESGVILQNPPLILKYDVEPLRVLSAKHILL